MNHTLGIQHNKILVEDFDSLSSSARALGQRVVTERAFVYQGERLDKFGGTQLSETVASKAGRSFTTFRNVNNTLALKLLQFQGFVYN